jgi:hypothetical protein
MGVGGKQENFAALYGHPAGASQFSKPAFLASRWSARYEYPTQPGKFW